MKKRPLGLVAIVLYKSFAALLLMITSIALLLTLKNYQTLEAFSENYVLEGKSMIIDWLLKKVINLNPRTLAFSGIGTGIYAIVTTIEAIGLWYEKRWAHVLVLGLVGISIPPEIYELIQGISPIKMFIFVLNLAVFGYLFRNFPKNQTTARSH
ncbi:hypothetical protein A4S05_27725 [Nostoc sp. KVJ20]|uniref:DUF2127 domain-containing protein n=1 Tax=unclassified Nostoc TaxID=2593658 RepID=UPI00083DA154|nr:DUF2127 domain-containing protein [Nostoc sp. KVJ20]ODH01700.1 hypothetical protein A4S05_27725 [Nostoc sp. KVJ20]